ncbi:MAG: DUF1800 domain-containing protein [Candidatus Sumerlaeaceae bacterium]|nr:DUF1800 domain-containing protein [Candidatus Sumerlaeaceae bacterium]
MRESAMGLLDNAFRSPSFRWDEASARHLLNRAGFGVPPAAVARLAAMKPDEAVASLVDYERFPPNMKEPDWIQPPLDFRELRQKMQGLSEDERRSLRNQMRRSEREAMSRLQMWWLDRICHTQRPLEEKLTLFWHGHFATSAEKVREPAYNHHLNQTLRQHASGNFRTLVIEVGKSPAMLRYLDNIQNRSGRPNENWARELMELFTLGIGHYTEQDIREAARAFTGWTIRNGAFAFDGRLHDSGVKTILGRTGRFDGEDVVDILLGHPACAEFISRKLWTYFAYENPEPEIVTGLAATLRDGGYELKPVLRRMFSSQAFYSSRARFSQIKSPAQLVAGLHAQLDVPLTERPPVVALAMRAMGQALFYPPNVKGWDGGRAWINTNTYLVRCNLASHFVSGVAPDFGGRPRGAGAAGTTPQQAEETMRDRAALSAAAVSDQDRPAGQDAMPPDNPSRTFAEALRSRRTTGRSDTRNAGLFQARAFFARFHGMKPAEIVDALAAYFLGFPLDETQRERLAAILAGGGSPNRPVAVTSVPEENLRAVVQLLLSLPDYQVC